MKPFYRTNLEVAIDLQGHQPSRKEFQLYFYQLKLHASMVIQVITGVANSVKPEKCSNQVIKSFKKLTSKIIMLFSPNFLAINDFTIFTFILYDVI